LCFFSSRRRHTRFKCDWSSDVCSSDLVVEAESGNFITSIETKSGAHNTICGLDGSRAYLAGLRSPWLFVADTKTHKVIDKVGPRSEERRVGKGGRSGSGKSIDKKITAT